ncbi:MarR family winged helix-turn-helix transcriptional regulator [Rhizobium sp. PL01]|jgi:DNA-binding MarR family transcriptional regulator|uniref:MarR family winged helix-turn-helix transcriptional regulator n=1 Tax=Rhizobium sp. PL01 TaxID=3085631 RepID=UPI002981729E|nr:MarR family transcriptional regulator [Rhizobium sp. PL01]MDW5316023.1 MarR family transcriptional regulator [Rhizobium sp. PL01]
MKEDNMLNLPVELNGDLRIREDLTGQAGPGRPQDAEFGDLQQVTYFELARLMERASRRFSGLIRAELTKLRVDDIGPAQAMILLAIGDSELSVAELLDRGHYVGSNVSYYLKQLGDGDYIDRVASQRDKRSARIKLTEKGRRLRANLRDAATAYERAVNRGDQEQRMLETAFQTLHQLELAWGSSSRYGG